MSIEIRAIRDPLIMHGFAVPDNLKNAMPGVGYYTAAYGIFNEQVRKVYPLWEVQR